MDSGLFLCLQGQKADLRRASSQVCFSCVRLKANGTVVKFQEGVGLAPVFEAGEGVQLDAVDGPENALLNVGIGLFQLPQQHLHLLALALPDAVAGSIPGLSEAASALQKFQMVVVSPGNDGILVDAVQRADQLHTGEILAMARQVLKDFDN